MYYGEDSGLPLYYRIYPGSITDKTHLKYTTEDTDLISHEQVKPVMNRGFYSADNLQYLVEKGVRFLFALPNSLKYCREMIEKYMAENKFTFRKVMLELRKARLMIAPKYPTGCRLMNPPSKIQKEILSGLGLPDDTLQAVCCDFMRTWD